MCRTAMWTSQTLPLSSARWVVPASCLSAKARNHGVNRLLDAERKKVSRVAPGVPVHLLVVGDDEGDVPVRKLVRTVQRMKPVLTKEELSVVNKRLKSLPSIRDAVPAGLDPNKMRMSRKGLRGR